MQIWIKQHAELLNEKLLNDKRMSDVFQVQNLHGQMIESVQKNYFIERKGWAWRED